MEKTIKKLTTVITLLFVVLSWEGYSQTSFNRSPGDMEWVGAWQFGPTNSVHLDTVRQIAFLSSGGAVLAADISNPNEPVLISQDVRTQGLVEDIWFDYETQNLYLACGRGGLEIWDVGDAASPSLLSRTEILYFDTETPVRHVELYNDYAILECEWGYVHSVDISDPYNPQQIAFNGVMGNPAHDIYVDENGFVHSTGAQYYARLAIGEDGSLTNTGQKDFDFGSYAVYGRQEEAFVSYSGSMYILDLTLPGFPAWSITEVAYSDITLRSDTCYLVGEGGFVMYDISSVQDPQLISSIDLEYGNEIALYSHYAFVSADRKGMMIIDFQNPEEPLVLSSFSGMSHTASLDISNDVAYLANGDGGLFLVDISEPFGAGPYELSHITTTGLTNDICVQDGMAYIADGPNGFRIADVSDPENPEIKGTYDIYARRIDVSGDFAYLTEANANNPDTLHVFDVSDPENPQLNGSLTLPGDSWEIKYKEGYAYVAIFSEGLYIYDVSDPFAPEEAAMVNLTDVWDVRLQGDIAYVASADWEGGLVTIDVADPETPMILQIYNPSGWFHPIHVGVSGDYAYAGELFGDMRILNVSQPSNIQELGTYNTPGDINNFYAQGNLLYVSNGEAGMQILGHNLPTINEKPDIGGENKVTIRPNPIRLNGTVKLTLDESSQVEIIVRSVDARKVTTIFQGQVAPGNHSFTITKKDFGSTGVAFLEIQMNEERRIRKIMFVD